MKTTFQVDMWEGQVPEYLWAKDMLETTNLLFSKHFGLEWEPNTI